MGGGMGNEFRVAGCQSLGPPTSLAAQIFKEENSPWPQPCPMSSECFVKAQPIRSQSGLRALSCRCGFWVMVAMRQMETVTQQQTAAVCHQAKAKLGSSC